MSFTEHLKLGGEAQDGRDGTSKSVPGHAKEEDQTGRKVKTVLLHFTSADMN